MIAVSDMPIWSFQNSVMIGIGNRTMRMPPKAVRR